MSALPNSVDIFVPGRLCLFGEHSDWAGGYRRIDSTIAKGYCLLVGTNQGIYARATRHPSKLIITSTLPDGTNLGPHEIDMVPEQLLEVAEEGGFYSYSAGVAYHVLSHYNVKGLEIESYKMDLPIRKGLSSSAANNVMVARAFNHLYDLKLTKRGEMEIAYQGEILTPSRCGRMDQACAYGNTPVFLTFDGERMDVEEIAVQEDIYLVVADLKAGKNTQKILADLNACYPKSGGKIGEDVRYYLGPVNKDILSRARLALREGNHKKIGALMTEAQRFFDHFMAPACPTELLSPTLHFVLSSPELADLTYGGKGVGSQGDGCVQLVAKGPKEQKRLVAKLKEMDTEPYPLVIKAQNEQQSDSEKDENGTEN
ncbi:GHMP kinase [candidate division KSB1 bacterium]|nr:GHMP kinase [candidate division KSB1 bacterium]